MISGKLKAQDTFFLQKAFQACLDHPEVQPHLTAVSFDQNKEVLAVLKNEYVTSELKLTQFGKEAVISHKTDLFFHSIDDYVMISGIAADKNSITLTITAGVSFTCTYAVNKDKVIKLKKSVNE